MAVTSLDFDSSTLFTLLDDSIAVIQKQCMISLCSSEINYSLNEVFQQHKSVKIEAAYTLESTGLAVIAHLDGADYPSLLILKRQKIIHRVDDILHNFHLKNDFLLFTRLSFPGRIQKLCFNEGIECTVVDNQGFCTPLRQIDDTLYYIQETSNCSNLRAIRLSDGYDYLISNEDQVICHSESGFLLRKMVNEKIYFSSFEFKDTIKLHDCSDCFLNADAIFFIKNRNVYKKCLYDGAQTLIASDLSDDLLYVDNRWVLTSCYDYLNSITYILYDQLNKEKIEIGTPALFELDSFLYTHLQSNFTFDWFRTNKSSPNRSVIISVYEGFDVDNEALISEQDQELWLNKGNDIIVFNAFKKIKADNPFLSNK
ncbi:hypothetical protein VCSRO199_1059 [Vibrio cholerae]|nr:hypothetical protein VCSRO199_1059 [Vibrio cholerae]